ncbi:carbohydrate binding family 9 domain-containing protein [bacterium]|nr:carbohydrate binding family 9 domain-containing protein [bacterium]
MKKTILAVLILSTLSLSTSLFSEEQKQVRIYNTKRALPSPPKIDGNLTDNVWNLVEWQSDFTQFEPANGAAPSQKTAFKILYDDKNIYVAIRAFDTEPDKIDKRLARRDNPDGDNVSVVFDSYFDHRTAFGFTVNAAGVQADMVFSNDGQSQDESLDLVWNVKTKIDDQGWTAEFGIPLSQLRFGKKQNQIWGLEIARQIFRKSEMDFWQPIPKDAPGLIHMIGELHGINNIKPKQRFEILPYSLAKGEAEKREPGNPFRTGRSANIDFGLDGKIGVTSDLTLDFTINPDFGQVEADPSVVNLTAYETFYKEKRPFFVEGNNILSYKLMIGDGDMSNANLFYSRRIGKSCSYDPDLNDNEYLRMPQSSSIIGAAKLTGKTKSGLSIGIMDAVTSKEFGEIDNLGDRRNIAVEPLTNYFVSRVKKDFNKGATTIGGMITNTYRNITDSHLEFLNRKATTGGIDINHSWHNRSYILQFISIFSHISGSTDAILDAQTSPVRYFQRPDADYVNLDSSRTNLNGFGGTLVFGKVGNSHINFMTGGTWRSPGLELNDLGYMRSADSFIQFSWVQYHIWQPFSIFNSIRINFNQWNAWNFGREHTAMGGNINYHVRFKNQWGLHSGINRSRQGLSSSMLRGGPSVLEPGSWNLWTSVNTDRRKKIRADLSFSANRSDDKISFNRSIRAGIRLRTSDLFSISASPFYSVNRDNLQYIDTIEKGSEKKYILGLINQKTLGLVLRFDLCLTPNLSIQFYGQPFVSAGSYSKIKRITSPRAENYSDRFHTFTEDEITYSQENGEYYVDENNDTETDYTISNPDFNFRQFRSNLVIRWQYSPGSTIYFVWSQERTGFEETGTFNYSSDMRDLFNVYPTNVVMLKINKWFSL